MDAPVMGVGTALGPGLGLDFGAGLGLDIGIESLTIPAALLMGLGASGHCLLMCGGISTATGIVALPGSGRRPPLRWLVASQLGRIASYTIAGLVAGAGAGRLVDWLEPGAVQTLLRFAMGVALGIAALVIGGLVRDPGRGLGAVVWRWLAPVGQRLLPLRSTARAFGFGLVWGWMPCGFVWSVLVIAALAADPGRGAATMAAFGTGTLPAMLMMSIGAAHWRNGSAAWLAGTVGLRRAVAVVLAGCALVTVASPWWGGHGADSHSGPAPASGAEALGPGDICRGGGR